MRILFAPATQEPATGVSSPKDHLKGWMADIERLSADTEPDPDKDKATTTKTKEADGKTNAAGRPADVAPPNKPAVAAPAAAKPSGEAAPEPSGDDKAGTGATKPAAETAPAPTETDKDKGKEKKEDWEAAPEPKGKKEWDKWKENRRTAETTLRNEIKSRDTQLAELQTKLTEVEAKAATTGELPQEIKTRLDTLEAENKQLTKEITILDVTAHPRFRQYYQKQTDAALAEAKMIVGDEHAAAIERILRLPDNEYRKAQLDEFLAGIEDDGVKMDIRGIVRDLRKVEKDKQSEIDKAKEHAETLNGQRAAESEKAQQQKEQLFQQTAKALQDPEKGFAPFQLRDGDDAWNKGVKERIELAKNLLYGQNVKPEMVARAAFHAAALPPVLESYRADLTRWKEEKAQLEARIAELVIAQPSAGGDTAELEPEDRMRIKKDMKPGDIAKEFARSAVAGLR